MPKLISDNDDLLDKLAALRRSANAGGTSNAVVERCITAVLNSMIEMNSEIKKVQREVERQQRVIDGILNILEGKPHGFSG